MRKVSKAFSIVVIVVFFVAGVVYAKTTMLAKWTSDTYVKSYHPDGFFADKYYGTVSVRGTDRKSFYNKPFYPRYSLIKYNVQGEIFKEIVYSENSTDNVLRVRKIVVKDQWDFGPVTTVRGEIGKGDPNLAPYSG